MRRLDVCGVFECAPWQLWERPTVVENALGLHLEATFLRHGGIPSRVTVSDLKCQWESCELPTRSMP